MASIKPLKLDKQAPGQPLQQAAAPTAAPRGALIWTLIALALTGATAWIIAWDLIPWLRGPAPYPPEWDWPHVPLPWQEYGAWLHLAAFVVYPLVVLSVLHPTLIPWRSERQRRVAGVVLAVVFFFGLQMALAHARKGNLLELVIFRVYAPPGNGYFMSAVRTDDIWATLHNYAAAMPNFPHDRPRTHPPAIFMYYAAFNALFERLPAFSDWFAPIARTWAPADRDWVQLQNPYIASAFFSGVTQWLLAAPVPAAFYLLLRRLQGRGRQAGPAEPGAPGDRAGSGAGDPTGAGSQQAGQAGPGDRAGSRAGSRAGDFAWWGTMLLPLLGSASSFYSHWDVNYLLAAALAWFFALRGQDRLHGERPAQGGGRRASWSRWLDWLWSGLLLGLLTWLSFGNAVLCVMVGGHLLWREALHVRRQWPALRAGHQSQERERLVASGGDGSLTLPALTGAGGGESLTLPALTGGEAAWRALVERRGFALGALLMIAAVVLPWLLAWLLLRLNYFEILQVGLEQHWIIVNNGRDFNIWRWMNLVDYALWVGPGVVLLGLVGSAWLLWHWRAGELEGNLAGLALVVWGALLVLNFSGAARAEVGRLWLFLMPWPVFFALAYLRTYGLRALLAAMLALTAWVMGWALRAV